jgi:acetyl esterase
MLRKLFALVALAVAMFAAVPAASQEVEFCQRLADRGMLGDGPQSIPGFETHVYRDTQGSTLSLHVLRPAEGTSTRAAVVAFSMGGWMFGQVEGFAGQARQLASRGLTVVLPDLRSFCRNGAGIVDEVSDAKAAMRWVRAHAVELGVDPDRIGAAGGSSAGHLALSTAQFTHIDAEQEAVTSSRPDFLLLFYPCVDPTSEVEQQFSSPAIADRGLEVSPMHHLATGLPPMIILQGSGDPLLADIASYCDRANALGNACEYHEFAGVPHGFFREGQAFYPEGMVLLDTFLERRGYINRAGS